MPITPPRRRESTDSNRFLRVLIDGAEPGRRVRVRLRRGLTTREEITIEGHVTRTVQGGFVLFVEGAPGDFHYRQVTVSKRLESRSGYRVIPGDLGGRGTSSTIGLVSDVHLLGDSSGEDQP